MRCHVMRALKNDGVCSCSLISTMPSFKESIYFYTESINDIMFERILTNNFHIFVIFEKLYEHINMHTIQIMNHKKKIAIS